MEFQRFTAPDAAALEISIGEHRAKLAQALQSGDDLSIVDHTSDLAGLLTTARREAEALALLQGQLDRAERFPASEVSGWFWNTYATALQYNGQRKEAVPVFAKALALSRAGGWGPPAILRAAALGSQPGRARRARRGAVEVRENAPYSAPT